MRRTTKRWLIAALLAAQAGAADAQVDLRGSHAVSGFPTVVASGPTGPHPAAVASPLAASTEPKSMTGMLAALNDARRRIGLAPLAWSQTLTAEADAAVRGEASGSCRSGILDRLAMIPNASAYWAGPSRQLTGDGTAQEILPSYVVSQWRNGLPDYDVATGTCRRDDRACPAFSHIAAPAAAAVGCAKTVCVTGAQIWVCRYSNQ